MFSLLVLATGWILVGAADWNKSEIFNSFENGTTVLTENTVFQNPAVSITDCASLCQQQDVCHAFTFDEKVCSGHRIWWTSSSTGQSTTGARLFVKESPCSSYTVINDRRRDVHSGGGVLDDRDLIPGWYRFLLRGSDAVMYEKCLEKHHCGHQFPYWLDLQGGKMPAAGQGNDARACRVTLGICCGRVEPVTIHNCGAFFVYKLVRLRARGAYCVTRKNK